ncbi:MAG: outer membrane protein assembly factor BamD [Deltaproteobacteria bacterium]|nr:outer membrane protein assembly factor BamD [Deltaproteobacteria bacterium]
MLGVYDQLPNENPTNRRINPPMTATSPNLLRLPSVLIVIFKYIKPALLVLALIFVVKSSLLAEKLELDEDQLWSYANHLYQTREYYRAVSEYNRLLYFFPEGTHKKDVELQIGRSLMAGGRTEEAIKHWEVLLDKLPDDHQTPRARILLGISLLDLNRAQTYRLRENNIKRALHQFEDIIDQTPESSYVFDFKSEWDKKPAQDYNSPWLAGILSGILPGAGSFYGGRYIEGSYAFFFTTLFIAASQESFKNKRQDLGAFFGVFAFAFYGGNIYTAINSAHKLNDKQDEDYLTGLRKKQGIWFIPSGLGVQGRF